MDEREAVVERQPVEGLVVETLDRIGEGGPQRFALGSEPHLARAAVFLAGHAFDVTVALEPGHKDAPRVLIDQLREGGIMVLPVGQSNAVQTLIRVAKTEKGLDYTDLGAVRFVPLVEGVAQDVLD